ncbi:MAG: glycosyltransferase family 4 protein [Nanoarchaeota archaeon]|nr:glycosyltransferase family 4 protein [Nanoarchaeota archaeon]
MKILFVLENYYPHIGGVEVVFKSLAQGLAKHGHDVTVLTHRLKNTKSFEIINKVKVHRINCFHSRYWFTFLAIPKAISLGKKAEIIHTTTYNGAFPAFVAAKLLGKPSLITVHEVIGKNWKSFQGLTFIGAKLHRFLEKLVMMLRFNKFISVSYSTQKQVLKENIPKEKCSVVYNGVDYDFFNPKKYNGKGIRNNLNLKNNFICLFYGRPGVSKGLEYLIKAIPLINKKIKNFRLLAIISKDRAYIRRYNYILNLIKKMDIEKNIILKEPVPRNELPDYIKAADCVIVPSLTEGFGFAAAESIAMKKPVVASNTTSLPEIISGKYVLVKPASPEAIAVGVEMVCNKKYNVKPIKRFIWDDNIKGYIKIYKEILNND